MSKRSLIFLTALTVLLAALPYVFAAQKGGGDFVFNGFLLNPLDGNSYLAKMREGWLGSWQFTMLYSSQPPEGSYLFPFYLFLGHAAGWMGLPLVVVFHVARVLGAIILCLMLYRFIETYLGERSARTRTIAYILACFGSGLGWLAALFGGFTADFWVAEAFPFLSMYSNPHFPLGLALVLDFLVQMRQPQARGLNPWLAIKGFLLGTLLPFAVPVAALIAGSVQLWELINREGKIRWWMLNFFVPGGLVIVYQFMVMRSDPVLAAWNSQNLTISPPLWDVVISFSPAFLLAVGAVIMLARQKKLAEYKILVVWLIGGLILAYFPFQLQRRFLLGYLIPAASLAAIALESAWTNPKRVMRIGAGILVGCSFLTNVLVLSGGLMAAAQRSPDLFYSKNLQNAFDWMLVNRKTCDVVLAEPETGMIIPGATGWRVVYGHPYETPNADQMKARVEQLYSGELEPSERGTAIASIGADFILIGPSEREPEADLSWADTFPKVFDEANVAVHQVRDCP
ncbi:MAG TPA: hypothetical protein VN364_03555 [Bellilinea sp.]|nr:hypothetical protein [Bellilinea sp.]